MRRYDSFSFAEQEQQIVAIFFDAAISTSDRSTLRYFVNQLPSILFPFERRHSRGRNFSRGKLEKLAIRSVRFTRKLNYRPWNLEHLGEWQQRMLLQEESIF